MKTAQHGIMPQQTQRTTNFSSHTYKSSSCVKAHKKISEFASLLPPPTGHRPRRQLLRSGAPATVTSVMVILLQAFPYFLRVSTTRPQVDDLCERTSELATVQLPNLELDHQVEDMRQTPLRYHDASDRVLHVTLPHSGATWCGPWSVVDTQTLTWLPAPQAASWSSCPHMHTPML